MTLEEALTSILEDDGVLHIRIDRDKTTRKLWVSIVERFGVTHTASSRKSAMLALAEAVLRRKRAEPVVECKEVRHGRI